MQYKRTLTALASAVALAACGANTEQAAAPANDMELAARNAKAQPSVYVVRMIDPPVTAYTGGINGLRATKPAPGTKIDPFSTDVTAYVRYLDGRHAAAAATVGASKLYDYRFSFNGFAARLTPAQAKAMAGVPGVISVDKDEMRQADTASTPKFLGLDDPSVGLWAQLGGPKAAGEGIIIGVVDSGIWPENPSFSDREAGKLVFQQIPGWHGRCVPGEAFNASLCNQKLIGAQYFNAGYGGNAGVAAQLPWEFNSVRDFNGHGSHTASTAGGNFAVATTGLASIFETVNGMAPRARIAMYKALWDQGDGTASGFTSDLVAAIDQAVADGVDVINYSISGNSTSFLDPVAVSFLFAADAGVFVATSAGNSGPTTSTVAHGAPWVTTVAAGTHNRDGKGSVTLGNAVTYNGASIATAVGPAPIIDSIAAGLPGADPALVALCYAASDNGGAPVLDPAKVAGKIVICDRGVTARVNKSLAVKEAGGVGMVLVNTSANSINADFHFVPSVHLQNTDRAAVKAHAATPGATAKINQATIVYDAAAPFTASFSSRGPLRAAGGDLLKPDLIAPGQDILAAVAPPGNGGASFNLYSGTSMSSPHVAGLAALLKDLHPSWTPMMIKSALMTTAYDILDGPNTNPLVIFRQGAGHVRPNSATDPGLVFNAGFGDWLAFLCGTQLTGPSCAGVKAIDPSDMNVPSIAIGDLAGEQTVSRTVTSVASASETYSFSYTGLTGITVAPAETTFTIAPGARKSLSVKFTTASAALNAYVGGQFTWTGDKGHVVRIPVVIRPVALAAPAEVSGSYSVKFGYAGPFTVEARGLIAPAFTNGTVTDDPTDSTCSLTSPNAQLITVAVPAGTTYARFALFDADVNPGTDIDLCVFRGTTQVGSSGSGTSAEQVSLLNPTAGDYTVVVQGWGVAGTSPFKLHTWLLGTAAAGNMTVVADPTTATIGGTGTVTLGFSGLASGTKYLGSVAYSGSAGLPNPTIVRVDAP